MRYLTAALMALATPAFFTPAPALTPPRQDTGAVVAFVGVCDALPPWWRDQLCKG